MNVPGGVLVRTLQYGNSEALAYIPNALVIKNEQDEFAYLAPSYDSGWLTAGTGTGEPIPYTYVTTSNPTITVGSGGTVTLTGGDTTTGS